MRGQRRSTRTRPWTSRKRFRYEYWNLEEAKLRRLPPEKELERQVIAVIGARRNRQGTGIGWFREAHTS